MRLASGSIFPVGTTTVACTARDARRNQGGGSFSTTMIDPQNQVAESNEANNTARIPVLSAVSIADTRVRLSRTAEEKTCDSCS